MSIKLKVLKELISFTYLMKREPKTAQKRICNILKNSGEAYFVLKTATLH